MEAACGQGPYGPDFVEGVAFTPDDYVLTTARPTRDLGPVSNYKGAQIYYQSLRSRGEDLMTMRDFLWCNIAHYFDSRFLQSFDVLQ
jgi:hypothetical protein